MWEILNKAKVVQQCSKNGGKDIGILHGGKVHKLGGGVQPDWNQNDPTKPDYVKNRTHYATPATVLKTGTLEFSDMDGIYGHMLTIDHNFSVGDYVTVYWDGVEYSLTVNGFDERVFIGNSAVLGGDDTGEPFIIACGEVNVICALSTEPTHTVGIVADVVTPLEKKFLPSDVCYLKDGFVPSAAVFPDVHDVFGSPIEAGGTYSTLAKPYPNKLNLSLLTVEKLNAMIDGTIQLPHRIFVENSIASVGTIPEIPAISVSWTKTTRYSTAGNGFSGVAVTYYDARIYDDTDNPGTVVSEYAIVRVIDVPLT